MLFKGLMVTALSGKLDGLIASHNRGGAYFKQHVIPVDPLTAQQALCRDALADQSNQWANLGLPAWNRWAAYAASQQVTNRLGDRRSLSPRAAFIRQTLPLRQKDLILDPGAVVDTDPPPNLTLNDIPTPPTFEITGARTFEITWVSSGWEALTPDTAHTGLVISLSSARAPTVNWFRGPFRHCWWIEADDLDPPTPPYQVTLGAVSPSDFPDFVVGLKYFFRVRLFWELHPNGHIFQSSVVADF